MKQITTEQLNLTYKEILSIIRKCERMEGRFAAGTAQHTLLKNRIHAMQVAKQLVEEKLWPLEISAADEKTKTYTLREMAAAIEPVRSIIRKCSKAQGKYEKGTTNYRRYEPMIKAMKVAERLMEEWKQMFGQ